MRVFARTDTYASAGILIHGAVGSLFSSGISARRYYRFLDDPDLADYVLRGHQLQVSCALRLYQPVPMRGSPETVDNVPDESEFVNAIGVFRRHC